jgi:hypothetical protein
MDQAVCDERPPPWRNPAPEKRWCRRSVRAKITDPWLAACRVQSPTADDQGAHPGAERTGGGFREEKIGGCEENLATCFQRRAQAKGCVCPWREGSNTWPNIGQGALKLHTATYSERLLQAELTDQRLHALIQNL